MKIVMTIPVHNHEHLIAENILYHASVGVDAFIITIHNSTDKTLEIVKELSKKFEIKIFFKETKFFYDSEWRTEMAMIAREEMEADWIISNDVDEFWVLESESKTSLKDLFQNQEFNVIYSYRYNMLPYSEETTDVVSPPRSFLYAITEVRDFDRNKPLDQITSLDFLLKPLTGKAACATKGLKLVHDGSHEIEIEDKKSTLSTEVSILHYPFFTREEYVSECKRRVEAGLRDKYRGTRANWHIQLMEYLLQNNQFEEFIDGIFVDKKDFESLKSQNVLSLKSQAQNKLKDLKI